MNFIDKKDIKPVGTVYRLKEEELKQLFVDYAKEKTGLILNLNVGCYEEPYDVYVSFQVGTDEQDIDDVFTTEEWDEISNIGIHPEEEFMNRDILLEKVFGSEGVSASLLSSDETEDVTYEIFVSKHSKNRN